MPARFTTAYESALAFGRIRRSLPEAERLERSGCLRAKYSPDYRETAEKYIAGLVRQDRGLAVGHRACDGQGQAN